MSAGRRTWIRPGNVGSGPGGCVMWTQLGAGRWLYVMADGRHGVQQEDEHDPLDRILEQSRWWEELA